MTKDLITDFTDTNAVSFGYDERVGGIWATWIGPFGMMIKYVGEL